MKFSIKMNYDASIICDVDAADEGEALTKAREMAEDADISEFSIEQEKECLVLTRGE